MMKDVIILRRWTYGRVGNPDRPALVSSKEDGIIVTTPQGLLYGFYDGYWRRTPETVQGYGFWALLEKSGTLTEVLPVVDERREEQGA